VIDVVRAEAGTHQFLEQIGLLVAALGRAEAGQRFRSAAVVGAAIADVCQRAAGEVERFFPGGFAEHVTPAVRVHAEVGRFRHAGLADQRHRQALLVVRVIEAVAALHAQAIVIRWSVAPVDADDGVVLDVVGQLAADAAVRADRINLLVGHNLVGLLRRRQRTGRTGLHALTTGDTGGCAHRVVEIEHDFRLTATKRVADHVVVLFLAAGAHAARALDAGVEVDRHRGVRKIGIGLLAGVESRCRHAEFAGPFGQFVFGRLVILRRRVGRQQLQHQLLRMYRTLGGSIDLHVVRRMPAARWRQRALALDLDYAGAAVAIGAIAGLVAEVRDLLAVLLGNFDQGLVFEGGNLFAVEGEFDQLALD